MGNQFDLAAHPQVVLLRVVLVHNHVVVVDWIMALQILESAAHLVERREIEAEDPYAVLEKETSQEDLNHKDACTFAAYAPKEA